MQSVKMLLLVVVVHGLNGYLIDFPIDFPIEFLIEFLIDFWPF